MVTASALTMAFTVRVRTDFFSTQIHGCTWSGLAASGGGVRSWIRGISATTMAHELGHNLRVWHAAEDFDNDGDQVNRVDILGWIIEGVGGAAGWYVAATVGLRDHTVHWWPFRG